MNKKTCKSAFKGHTTGGCNSNTNQGGWNAECHNNSYNQHHGGQNQHPGGRGSNRGNGCYQYMLYSSNQHNIRIEYDVNQLHNNNNIHKTKDFISQLYVKSSCDKPCTSTKLKRFFNYLLHKVHKTLIKT